MWNKHALLRCGGCKRNKNQCVDNLEEDKVALLESVVLYSDAQDWDKAIQEAEELKAKVQDESLATTEQTLLKLRKDFDKQGSFSVNLISYLAIRQAQSGEHRDDGWAASSVATSCSSLGW